MKAALAASLVFGMSSFAYAADASVGGKFRTYFGQYNSGADDYSSHFDVREEANLKFNGKAGKLSVYHELESATGSDYNNTQTKLTYATPIGALAIGNVTSIGTIPMSSSGWSTSNIPYATRRALVWAGYSENEGLQLTVPLEGMGLVQFTMYEDSSNAGASTAKATASGLGATVPTSTEGSSMQLAANLKFGTIGVRVGYATAKTDDPASTNDDAMSTTNMLVGVKVALNKMMSVAFDYATDKTSYDAWSDDLKATAMDFDFTMGGIAGGKIVLSMDMTTVKGSDKIYDRTVTSFLYDMPVAKGAGIQAGYISNAKKTESTGDTVTETFMGAGFYASF